jgi:HrpA-like RNA helicase
MEIDEKRTLQEQRKNLPIYEYQQEIIEAIKNNLV